MRVLALADACNPEWPSLPVVGYQYAKALAEHVDLTVVTQVRNKVNIEKAGLGCARVVFLDTEWIAAPLVKAANFLRGGWEVGWTLQVAMDYPSYVVFEREAWRMFRRELKLGAFDVVHRLTPMSPTLPSPLASLSPAPFVLGPLNGNLAWPKGFEAEFAREREWLRKVRDLHKLMPYHRSTYASAKAILAAFEHTMHGLPDRARPRAINFPEVGFLPDLFSPAERALGDRLTILFVGRLVPYKMPEIVVQAFADSPSLRRHRLVVVGEGPERPRLERMIADAGLGGTAELLGQRSQAEVAALMRDAHIFAFPSIRELGAGVVVEAMACGMACVVADYGGPVTLVGPDRGIKVPLADRDSLARDFRLALEGLVADPVRVSELGRIARRYAMAHYTWDAKARQTLAVYEWVLGRRPDKPDVLGTVA